jgi:hypothetical protein
MSGIKFITTKDPTERAQHRLHHTPATVDEHESKILGMEVVTWKETWHCPLCHTKFTFTNSNA